MLCLSTKIIHLKRICRYPYQDSCISNRTRACAAIVWSVPCFLTEPVNGDEAYNCSDLLCRGNFMHRHGRFRPRPPRFYGPRRPLGGLFWLVPLALLVFGGSRWWPLILIMIGMALMFAVFARRERPPSLCRRAMIRRHLFLPRRRRAIIRRLPSLFAARICCQRGVPAAARRSTPMTCAGRARNRLHVPIAART